MLRNVRLLVRVAALSIVVAPCIAWADALPSDPDDIYYHCTPEEQCPQGSASCRAIHGAAGHRSPDADCAAQATEKKLVERCLGKSGYLYCPNGATGSWKEKAKPNTAEPGSTPRRGC